jgi:tRNA-guanine family transglycosylase
MLGATLLTIHNLKMVLDLMGDIRTAIADGRFDSLRREFPMAERQMEKPS